MDWIHPGQDRNRQVDHVKVAVNIDLFSERRNPYVIQNSKAEIMLFSFNIYVYVVHSELHI
jgi:hypothetical protein